MFVTKSVWCVCTRVKESVCVMTKCACHVEERQESLGSMNDSLEGGGQEG